MRNSPKKIVLTGGPGVGKTSIIRHLQKLNHDVREEVFTKIFADAQRTGQFNDEFLHSQKLVHDLVNAQKKLESQPSNKELVFLDRSKIDILVFSNSMKIIPLSEDQIELDQNDYSLFFIIEPLPSHFYDQNLIRRQTFPESLEHHQSLVDGYIQFLKGQNRNPESCIIRVPFIDLEPSDSIQERTRFILDEISKRL